MLDDSRFVRDAAARRLRESAGTGGDGKPALWAEGFGNWSARDGDGNAARVTDSTGGLMGSVDVGLFGTWRLGVIGGYSHTNIAVAARTSEAQSANYHLGAYAGAQWDAWRVRLGAAHSWQSVRTTRSTPSAPSPARRSHNRATRPARRSSALPGSGRITKSFSVPCPLPNRMC